ncbi:MAG: restriction endonuclease [Calditrichia bacterium]
MAIPDYQSLMKPILEILGEYPEGLSSSKIIELVSDRLNLTREERSRLLKSGRQTFIANRVHWANIYLHKAGLLDRVDRGVYKLSERGLKILKQNPPAINNNLLSQFAEFRVFVGQRGEKQKKEKNTGHLLEASTPVELIEQGYDAIKEELTAELIQRIKSVSPRFFERMVLDLLLKMGYGDPAEEAAILTGKGADEGIDGLIKEDILGLDVIYIQAKRWEQTVGRPEIQRFVGALHGKRARKGIFITTSDFTKDARNYVKQIEPKVILIDGKSLAERMIQHNLGVSVQSVYEIKRVDSDYFEDA